jgi:hypothetical protein
MLLADNILAMGFSIDHIIISLLVSLNVYSLIRFWRDIDHARQVRTLCESVCSNPSLMVLFAASNDLEIALVKQDQSAKLGISCGPALVWNLLALVNPFIKGLFLLIGLSVIGMTIWQVFTLLGLKSIRDKLVHEQLVASKEIYRVCFNLSIS